MVVSGVLRETEESKRPASKGGGRRPRRPGPEARELLCCCRPISARVVSSKSSESSSYSVLEFLNRAEELYGEHAPVSRLCVVDLSGGPMT